MFRKILSLHKTNNELLLDAARNGNTDEVLFALQKRADINCSGFGGKTSLILAAIKGHLETANLLISKGAEINDIDNNSSTALLNAVLSNQIEMVEFLLHKGANPNIGDCYNRIPLFIAISSNHKNSPLITKMLLDNGAKFDLISSVREAVKQNSIEKVKYLLEMNIFKDRNFIYHIIENAIKIGNDQIINDLLAHKDDCFILPGRDTLKIAINHFLNDKITTPTIKKLIRFNQYFLDNNPYNLTGCYGSCLLSLIKSNHPDAGSIISLILSRTVNNASKSVYSVNNFLSKCLYELVQLKPHQNRGPIAEILLEYGADPYKTFNNCTFWTDSAFTIAKRNQNTELRDIIYAHIRSMREPVEEVKSANENEESTAESLFIPRC